MHLHDLDRFIDCVHTERGGFFAAPRPLVVARAPARLDVLGGTAADSGSLVLQLPLAVATYAALQPDPEPILRIMWRRHNAADLYAEVPLAALMPGGNPVTYAHARMHIAQWLTRLEPSDSDGSRWYAALIGCWIALMREEFVRFPGGARLLIASDVPPGVTAPVEVAVMQALAAAYNGHIAPRELALHCQTVTKQLGGTSSSVIDPLTAMCGSANHLIALRCQPGSIVDNLHMPHGVAVWGIVSGELAALSARAYNAARVGAAMGYRIIAEIEGLVTNQHGQLVQIRDTRWGGYLANLLPSEYTHRFRDQLPLSMRGDHFIAQYGGLSDTVADIDPAYTYAIREPTEHPIYEHLRVRHVSALLAVANHETTRDEALRLIGELMAQSHQSHHACGLGSPGAEGLVELVHAAGVAHGLYGARRTDGGMVVILGRSDAGKAVQTLVEHYTAASGHAAHSVSGSSPGGAASGVCWIDP